MAVKYHYENENSFNIVLYKMLFIKDPSMKLKIFLRLCHKLFCKTQTRGTLLL